jgi:hypothetical protein
MSAIFAKKERLQLRGPSYRQSGGRHHGHRLIGGMTGLIGFGFRLVRQTATPLKLSDAQRQQIRQYFASKPGQRMAKRQFFLGRRGRGTAGSFRRDFIGDGRLSG